MLSKYNISVVQSYMWTVMVNLIDRMDMLMVTIVNVIDVTIMADGCNIQISTCSMLSTYKYQ